VPIVSVPIKVSVSADTMLSSELGTGMRRREFITLIAAPRRPGRLRRARSRRREAARSDCTILRIDLELDPVAGGLAVAVVSKLSREVKS
jgi:hypothetical protein